MPEPAGPGLAEHACRTLIARARWAAALLALVTLLAGWQSLSLRVEVDLSGLIGPGSQGAQSIRDYAQRFTPVRAEEVLLITAPTLGSDSALEALESYLLELQFLPGIENVISLFSLPGPDGVVPWLYAPGLAALPAPERLATLRASVPLAAQLLSADLTATIVVAVPEAGAGGPDFARAVAEALPAENGLELTPIGLAAVQREIASELIRDLSVLTPSAVVICLMVALVLFRGWRAVVACALPPVVGLVWFAGWLGAAGIPIDPVMGALPVVLIVLAFSDSIYIWHAALHDMGPESAPSREATLARAVVQTAPAAILTSATTMIAFASLALPASPSLNRMALTGVAGLGITLAAVLLLMPVLMALLNAPRPGDRVPRAFTRVVPPALRASRAGGWAPVAALALLAALWAVQSQSRAGFRYADYLPAGAAVTGALADAEARGLGSDRLMVVVEAEPAMGPTPNAQAAARAVWGEEYAPWLASAGGAEMLARMASGDGSAHALPVQLPISASGAPGDAGLRALEARIEAAGLRDVARVIGPGHALITEGPRLVESLRLGLYLTIGAVMAAIALAYRSARLAALAVVPSLIPLLGVEAFLVLAGGELTIMNMIALTVAFGIAVDDTLHFLNRYRLARGATTAARIDSAIMTAGPPMAATTLVLMAGLLVTLASALPGLATFGLLIGLAVVLALLANLFLYPGLLRWGLG